MEEPTNLFCRVFFFLKGYCFSCPPACSYMYCALKRHSLHGLERESLRLGVI